MSFLFVCRAFLFISSAKKLLSLGILVGNPLSLSFASFAVIQIYKMSSQSWVWNTPTDQYAWRPGTVATPGHYLNPLCSPEGKCGSARPISHSQGYSPPGSAGSGLRGTLPISNLPAIYTPNGESALSFNLNYHYLSTCQHLHSGPQQTTMALHCPVRQHRGA